MLAIVAGKLSCAKKNEALRKQLVDNWRSSLKIDVGPSIGVEEKAYVWLFLVVWDEVMGPRVTTVFPSEIQLHPVSIQSLGLQLFQIAISIYGWEGLYGAHGILLPIENIQKSGYIFFDAYSDQEVRRAQRRFMLAVIAPKINICESFKLQELFKEIATHIKAAKVWDIKKYWETISEILTTPVDTT